MGLPPKTVSSLLMRGALAPTAARGSDPDASNAAELMTQKALAAWALYDGLKRSGKLET